MLHCRQHRPHANNTPRAAVFDSTKGRNTFIGGACVVAKQQALGTFRGLVSTLRAGSDGIGRGQEALLPVAHSAPLGAAILGQPGMEPVVVLLVVIDHGTLEGGAVAHDFCNLAPFLQGRTFGGLWGG